MINVQNFLAGDWMSPNDASRSIQSAVSGETIARAGSDAVDFQAILDHARSVGGPALRALSFHDRARILKALALHLSEHKQQLYELSYLCGSTLADSKIDIDGGIGTLMVYASKGRRELPDDTVLLDGDLEQLSRSGTFVGQHMCFPKRGVALHINAFNFPVWGMLEKLAPALLAGMPAVVKPATVTSYITEACFHHMIDSGLMPEGSVQLLCGGTGDILDRLTPQDVVAFTGSADTALMLRQNQNVLRNSVPFVAEQDSLNASVLGADVTPDMPEFDLFVSEVYREMTAKAGQKCTAIRRIMVPHALMSPLSNALGAKLSSIVIGDPSQIETQMGPVVSQSQRTSIEQTIDLLKQEAQLISGDAAQPNDLEAWGTGAFVAPVLLRCDDPDSARHVHEKEAFGPVSTLMAYRDNEHACELLALGGGSLVASVITHDPAVARDLAVGSAAWHGRIYINDRDSMKESTGHGSPLPHMVHGGPGRAGGGEELGGIRAVKHYMQRTAIQGSPNMISAVGNTWVPGASREESPTHPFTQTFHQLKLGQTLQTKPRTISLEDIEHFAHFTGDTFYAHMDEDAAKANPFFPGRVAHGYLLLSFAAGLFVEPNPGPVLANTGLSNLSFQKPVSAGDSIYVKLTVRKKTRRNDEYGEVRWYVELFNQDEEPVATYELHTMVAFAK